MSSFLCQFSLFQLNSRQFHQFVWQLFEPIIFCVKILQNQIVCKGEGRWQILILKMSWSFYHHIFEIKKTFKYFVIIVMGYGCDKVSLEYTSSGRKKCTFSLKINYFIPEHANLTILNSSYLIMITLNLLELNWWDSFWEINVLKSVNKLYLRQNNKKSGQIFFF